MRAMRVTGPGEGVRLVEVDDPAPSEDEVLVRVLVAGVNPVDGEIIRGEFGEVASYPRILGVQGAGVVEGGDPDARVMFFGAYGVLRDGAWAERVSVSRHDLIPVPHSVSDEDAAAFLLPAVSAFGALRRGGFTPGQRVLIPAAGGAVGRMAIKLATLLGASSVITTAGTSAKAEQARAEGIEHVIDLSTSSIVDQVPALTDGAGVDLVVDTVGGSTFASCLAACAANATVVSVGAASGDDALVNLMPLRRRLISILGFNVMWVMFEPGLLQEALGTVVPLLASGDLRPHVAASFPLEAGGHAIESLSNDRPYGSYVLQIA